MECYTLCILFKVCMDYDYIILKHIPLGRYNTHYNQLKLFYETFKFVIFYLYSVKIIVMAGRFIDTIFNLPNDISKFHTFVYNIDDNFKHGYISYAEESSLEKLFASIIGIPLEYSLYFFNRSMFSDIENIISESYGIFLIMVNKDYSKLTVHIPSRIAMTKVFIVNSDNESFKLLIPNSMHSKHIPEIQAIIICLYTVVTEQNLQVCNTWYKILQLFKESETAYGFYERVRNLITNTEDKNNDFQHYLQHTHKHIDELGFESSYKLLLENPILLSSITSQNFIKLLNQCKYKKNSKIVTTLEAKFKSFTEEILHIPSINHDGDCKSYLVGLKQKVDNLCNNLEQAVENISHISIKISDDVFQFSVDDILYRTIKINHVPYSKFLPYIERKRIRDLVESNITAEIHYIRDVLNSLENGKVLQMKLQFLILKVIPLCMKSSTEITKGFTNAFEDRYVVDQKEMELLITNQLQPLYDNIKTQSEYHLLIKLFDLSKKILPENKLAEHFKEETFDFFVCKIIDILSGLSPWDIVDLCLTNNTSRTIFLEYLDETFPRLNSLSKLYSSYCKFFVPTSSGAKFIEDGFPMHKLELIREYIKTENFFNGTFVKITPSDTTWTSYTLTRYPFFPIEISYNAVFINARDTLKKWEQSLSNEISQHKIREIAECLRDVCHQDFKYISSTYTLDMLNHTRNEYIQWEDLGIIEREESFLVSAKLNKYIKIIDELQSKLGKFPLQNFIMGCKCKEIQISDGHTTSFMEVLKAFAKSSVIEIDHSMLEYSHNEIMERLLETSREAKVSLMEMRRENPFYLNKIQEILHKTLLNVLTNDPVMISDMSPLNNIDNFTFFIYIVQNVTRLLPFLDNHFIIKECLTKYRDSIICNQYDKVNTVLVPNKDTQWTKSPWSDFSTRKNIQEHLLRYLLSLDNISFRNKVEYGDITLSCAELQSALFHFGKELCYIFHNEISHNDMNILHNITPSNPSVLQINNILTNIGYVLQSHTGSFHVSLLIDYFNLLKNSNLLWAFLNVEEQPTIYNLIILHKLEDKTLRVTECNHFTKYPLEPFTISETLKSIKSNFLPKADNSNQLPSEQIVFLYEESIYLQGNVGADIPVVKHPYVEIDPQTENVDPTSFPIQSFEYMLEDMVIPRQNASQFIPVKTSSVYTQTIHQPMSSPEYVRNDCVDRDTIKNIPGMESNQLSLKDTVYEPKDFASEYSSQKYSLRDAAYEPKDVVSEKSSEKYIQGEQQGLKDIVSKHNKQRSRNLSEKNIVDSELNKTIIKTIPVHIQTRTIASGTISPHYYWYKNRLKKNWESLQSKIAEIEESISSLNIN